ncbi:MAG: DEAD/DEAH box helicase [Leptospirales bacterium]|nr:DEAD/DEAH box helicase [Leptospirales bacterium]
MNLPQFVDFIKQDLQFGQNLTGTFTVPEAEARYAPIPDRLDPRLMKGLAAKGLDRLYTHQAAAISSALNGNNTLVVTPTASGKSLTYMLPIFQKKLTSPQSRALLLFPTKALSQDQQAAINEFNASCETDFKIFTFDGDTSPEARRRIMEAGDFVVTNPDMLHAGILPHHTLWIKLFENLDFIVIDELHIYRGVFGSHVANLLRRLLRIAAFYGKHPQILAASATIGNPKEHAERLTGQGFTVVDENGAPRGARHILFYNPPVVNQQLGIRASALKETASLGAYLLKNRIRVIFFCRSRLRVELLYTYLVERCPELKSKIRAYRGGYLPNERRKIERELREGSVLAVVSTNALELGVDIGMLDVAVCMGYPGSISSLMQQFGRAGRRSQESLSILVATSDGTDQYLIQHPADFLTRNPEQAMVNPDNLLIVADHIKCATFELPFKKTEAFGNYSATLEVLEHLAENHVIHGSGESFHWMSDVYPANTISLRSGPRENFAIIDVTEKGREEVIGEVDYYSAPTMIHQHAIYIHQGKQYYVDDLLWDERQARVRRIEEDYYTDAHEKVNIEVLEDQAKRVHNWFELSRGELSLRTKAVMFKKIKLETHENLGWGDIHTPEIEMHTQGAWILLPEDHPIRSGMREHDLGAMLAATAFALSVVSPLFVMCDPRDMRFRSEVRSAVFHKPVIYMYDSFPGGMELSYRVIENLPGLAMSARDLVEGCGCENGCPSCIGLPDDESAVKANAIKMLEALMG